LRAGRLLGDIGRTHEGERTIARAQECFDRAGIDSPELAFVTALTFSWQGPHPVTEDIERAEHALSLADDATPIAAYNLLGLAVSRALIGDFDEARSHLKRGASILRELGMTIELAASVGLSGGFVEMLAGDLEAAEATVRLGYETLKEMGESLRVSSRAALLANILYLQQRYDEAMDLADEADVSARDDMEPRIWLRGVRAKVLARRGRFDEAELEARDNARLAEETDWPGYKGMAWSDLAEVSHLAGRPSDAVAAARRAEGFLEAKGSLVLLDRIRTFREEMEAERADG
jgi:tetratricopeptide (TPR) repeat protein